MQSALAELRLREDRLNERLEAVRSRLTACVAMTRELSQLQERDATLRAQGGAYRSEAAIVAEKLASVRHARVDRASLRLEEASLMTELESIREGLENRGIRRVLLPLLDDVRVAAPCNVSWSDMDGDSDVRHCSQCNKHVYNLSMMSRAEAEAVLVAAKASEGVCVRFYRRKDGTVLTDDCPVGVRRARFWRRTAGIAAAGLLLAATGAVLYQQLVCSVHMTTTSATAGAGGFD